MISACCLPAAAEVSPWFFGASQNLSADSNLYRITAADVLPDPYHRSDLIATTSVFGGYDRSWGRQRVNASASLRGSRFKNNRQLDNNGYGIDATLDWTAAGGLSGLVHASADQNLAQFTARDGNSRIITRRNLERTNQVDTTFKLGTYGRLSLEAGLGWRDRAFSAQEYETNNNHQVNASFGGYWRPREQLQLGISLRATRGVYPHRLSAIGLPREDRFRRGDVDFSAQWRPTGSSDLTLRVSPTSSRYDQEVARNLKGITGLAQWNWQPGARLSVSSQISRDNGQSTDVYRLGVLGTGVVDFGRFTTALRSTTSYSLTGKTSLSASLSVAERTLVNSRQLNVQPATAISGSDTTTSLSVGARWIPNRTTVVGCNVGKDRRTASNQLTWSYTANTVGCFGQVTLQ